MVRKLIRNQSLVRPVAGSSPVPSAFRFFDANEPLSPSLPVCFFSPVTVALPVVVCRPLILRPAGRS